MPSLPSHLLEGDPLAGNDQETKEVYEKLTIAQDIVTLQIDNIGNGGEQ